ncbi:MAG: helix-turn-helix transcriptional regulator [Clostridia bacterium]|nr:helix-turn-helix transcriptional regulator [Clostridia bacterium]
MNLLQKLSGLMETNGDSVADLSRKANLPYSTVIGLFKKGFAGARINTIEAICRSYGVSLDYMIRDEIDDPTYGLSAEELDPPERRLLRAWRGAEAGVRVLALEMLENHQTEKETENLA